MQDSSKTKAQLIAELEETRHRVAALEALEAARHKSLIESDPFFTLSLDMLAIIGFDGYFKRLNPTFTKILGYSDDELRTTPVRELVHPDDREATRNEARRLQIGGLTVNFENRYRCKDGSYRWFNWTIAPFVAVKLFYAVGRDVTEQKAAEAALKYHAEFEQLLTRLSTEFINLPLDGFDEAITRSLQEVGRFVEADRSYLFLFSDDLSRLRLTHFWVALGLEGQSEYWKAGVPTARYSWGVEQLKRFEIVHIPRVSEMPSEAEDYRKELEKDNTQSIIIVPLHIDQRLVGFVGFSSVHQERTWSDDTIDLLRIVGEIYINALERRRAENVLQEHIAFQALIVQLSNEFINMSVDHIDDALGRALQTIVDFVGVDRGFIGVFSDDLTTATTIHEAVAKGVEPSPQLPQNVPMSQYPWSFPQLKNLEVVDMSQLDVLPPEAEEERDILAKQGIQSTIVVPLSYEGMLIGYVGYDMLHSTRKWSQNVIDLLRIGGEIFVNALERRRAEGALQHHIAFQALIVQLSNEFINMPVDHIDSGLIRGLQTIVEFVDADRGFIGVFSDDLTTANIIHKVAAPGIEPLFNLLPNVPTTQLPWLFDKLKNLEVVDWSRLDILPPEAEAEREAMRVLGNQSSIIVPLSYDGVLIGYLGYDMVRSQREWSQDVIGLLRICGEIFVNAMQRQKAAREFQEKEQLRVMLDMEQEVSTLRKTLLSMVSHDLRAPLASMQISADLLLRQVQPGSATYEERVNRIQEDIQRLTKMLDDLSLVVQSREGRLSFRPFPADLDDYCRSIVASVTASMGADLNIHYTSDGDLNQIPFDKTLLHHALTNLLTNAVKYSSDGGMINVAVRRQSDSVLIEIRDEGIGISEDDQAQLFEPYFRSEHVSHIRGTGLGLRIVYDCITLHGGEIEVESESGVGSTFRITLPVAYE